MDWDALFQGLSSFILHIGDRESGADSSTAEYVLIKICNYLHVLTAIKATLVSGSAGDRDLVDLTSTISSLIDDIEELYT